MKLGRELDLISIAQVVKPIPLDLTELNISCGVIESYGD